MSLRLFHQSGHCANWNRDSFEKDNIGDGIIFSPVHETCKNVSDYSKKLKSASLFDPQFYLPSSQKQKLQSYSFFPNSIMGEKGFSTIDFMAVSYEAAKRCIEFQLENDFLELIIPARFYEYFDDKYIDGQSQQFVHPFLEQIKKQDPLGSKKVLLTVPMTSSMVNSNEYRSKVLNWITSYPEIDGVYMFCQHDRGAKQINDLTFLTQYMDVIKASYDADLEVLVGYSNTESLLYTLAGEISLTIGAFENTRMFSLDKFIVTDGDRRGPKARIYLPKLLNWINFDEAKILKDRYPHIWSKIYTASDESDEAFELTKDPAFNSAILYKHYFKAFSDQIGELSSLSIQGRYKKLNEWIDEAIELHDEISKHALRLDKHGNGDHLNTWSNAIRIFAQSNGLV